MKYVIMGLFGLNVIFSILNDNIESFLGWAMALFYLILFYHENSIKKETHPPKDYCKYCKGVCTRKDATIYDED